MEKGRGGVQKSESLFANGEREGEKRGRRAMNFLSDSRRVVLPPLPLPNERRGRKVLHCSLHPYFFFSKDGLVGWLS